mgnify:CR=1 FL=1
MCRESRDCCHWSGHRPAAALLLCLHPPVLEPDLDLSLRQAQRGRQLQSPRSTEISVVMIFLLQLDQLASLECGPGSLGGNVVTGQGRGGAVTTGTAAGQGHPGVHGHAIFNRI